jgi:4-amino-4-deoxy-L-arabinose transferase-like glycosyltransferase
MTEAAAFPTGASVLRRLARWPAATLFLLCLIAWVPGFFTLPPLDRDESRFAQASKQMVETGNLVDIRFSEGARYNKPIGIYWLQSASAKIFGGREHKEIWTYRVPSLIGGFLALLFAYWCARAFASRETALLSAALLGATLLATAEAKIATTDAVLLATILAAQAVFLRVYLAARDPARQQPGLGIVLAGWVAVAVGILIKGPVILAVLGVTLVAVSVWDRDWRWLKATRPGLGFALVAILVAPWAIAIGIESHGAFYRQSLGHDFANKIIGGQESHGALPGYFLLLSSVTLWPATLLALPGIVSGIAFRRHAAPRYLLSWAAATWLLFELVPTKLPHYILPAYPALAMLGALWAMRPALLEEARADRIARIAACVQFFLVTIALAAVPIVAAWKFGIGIAPLVVIGDGAVGAIGAAATIILARRKALSAALLGILAAIVVYPILTLGLAPKLPPLWVSPQAAALIAKDGKSNDPPVVLAGYVEPSLVFLLGTNTRLETGHAAADDSAGRGGLVLVEDHERQNFLTELGARGAPSGIVDALAGYDYSRGRSVHLTLYRVTQAPTATPPPAR